MGDRLDSPRFVRRVTWAAALVLVAGIIAAAVTFIGRGSSDSGASPQPVQPARPVQQQPEGSGDQVPVDRRARVVAGEFILSAVTRENLPKAWRITDPTSVLRQCGERACTYKEWLTGNIPVVPYEGAAIDKASFAVTESRPDHVVLEVALLPKDGVKVRGQIFFIGLRAVGAGPKRRWLVNEWTPRAIIPVPQAEG